jgi:hypothetical protein
MLKSKFLKSHSGKLLILFLVLVIFANAYLSSSSQYESVDEGFRVNPDETIDSDKLIEKIESKINKFNMIMGKLDALNDDI